jgi:hypothetical protein
MEIDEEFSKTMRELVNENGLALFNDIGRRNEAFARFAGNGKEIATPSNSRRRAG